MSTSTKLIDLQKRQNEHDRVHHPDIYNTSYPDRMNHYVLHFSKYVGRLSRQDNNEGELEANLSKTIADSFIVGLAAANTLNLDLKKELSDLTGTEVSGVGLWTEELSSEIHLTDSAELNSWLFSEMAGPTGRMGNAMESLDHMESMNVREILEDSTVKIVFQLMIVAGSLNINLEGLITDRWNEIEEKSIL